MSEGSPLPISALSYIFVPLFQSKLMLAWLLLRFLHSFSLPCHAVCSMFTNSVCAVLLLSLYKNLYPSSFLLSSRGGSYASTCSDSTTEVVKMSVYIYSKFLVYVFLVSLGKLCSIVGKV